MNEPIISCSLEELWKFDQDRQTQIVIYTIWNSHFVKGRQLLQKLLSSTQNTDEINNYLDWKSLCKELDRLLKIIKTQLIDCREYLYCYDIPQIYDYRLQT
jgi:hypothetical protein